MCKQVMDKHKELTSGSLNFHTLILPSDDAENKMSAAGDRARPFTLE